MVLKVSRVKINTRRKGFWETMGLQRFVPHLIAYIFINYMLIPMLLPDIVWFSVISFRALMTFVFLGIFAGIIWPLFIKFTGLQGDDLDELVNLLREVLCGRNISTYRNLKYRYFMIDWRSNK